MIERTFVMIKPDSLHLAEELLQELDQHGKRIKTANITSVPVHIIENHYSAHKEKHFYNALLNEFANKPVVIAVYEGENIVQKFIDFIGPTDPSTAPKNTIRARYSQDSKEKAEAENRVIKNVVHRSGSIEEAKYEIEVWQSLF